MQLVADGGVRAVGELEILDGLLHQRVLVRLRKKVQIRGGSCERVRVCVVPTNTKPYYCFSRLVQK